MNNMRRPELDEHTENDTLNMENCNQHCRQTPKIEGVDSAKLHTDDSANWQYLNAGVILHDRYRVNSVIGQGGFGITYDGTDLNLDMHIAIKEYFPKHIASRYNIYSKNVTYSSENVSLYEHGMRNFLKEARNMAKFTGQENFVYVSDYFSENGTAYIIMEYVPGKNLKNFLEEHGLLTLDEVMRIINPVMNAVEVIHERNMIHRDISPSNIMILPDGKVKLLDFGAVREVSAETQSLSTMSSVYKYGYSPIEQQTRDMKQGTYSDVYALCATIYKMLTGITPPSPFARLSGEEILLPPSQVGVQISSSQEETLMEGLAIYGNDRIQTVGELRNGLFSAHSTYALKSELAHKFPLKRIVFIMFFVSACILAVVQIIKAVNTKKKEVFNDYEMSDEQTDIPSDAIAFNGHEEDSISKEKDGTIKAQKEVEEENSSHIPFKFPDGTVEYRGHHYFIYNDNRGSWENAAERCVARGGYMAVINDSEENEFLYKYMLSMDFDGAFFGLVRDDSKNWRYLGGDTSDFEDWGENSKGIKEPNDQDGQSKYASMNIHMNNGHWDDVEYGKQVYTPEGMPYKNLYTYICEWDK